MSFIICKEVLIVTYLMSAILGLVQGVAEFLPISSSGHLTLLQHFFGMEESDQLLTFLERVLENGSILAEEAGR